MCCRAGGPCSASGAGRTPNHYRGYGIPIEERNDRFVEGLDLALRAWKEDVLDYDGQYYQAEGIRLEPKPIQRPHPPVYIALQRGRHVSSGGQPWPQHPGDPPESSPCKASATA